MTDPIKNVEPASFESIERDDDGEVAVVTREMTTACERMIWDILFEAERQDNGILPLTLQQILDAGFDISEFTTAGLVSLAALAFREAMKLRAGGK